MTKEHTLLISENKDLGIIFVPGKDETVEQF
jgi:hypothetical protein